MSEIVSKATRSLLSRRVANASLQKGRSVLRMRANEMKERGIDIIDMSGYVIERPYGEFDSPPEYVRNALRKAIDSGWPNSSPRGLASFRNLISDYEGRFVEKDLDPNKNVIVTCGGSMQALYNIIQATVNPGDEVILFRPGLPYDQIIMLAEGVPVYVDLKEREGYRFIVDDVERKITEKTKVLIVNTPHNPSGHVATKSELQELAHLVIEHDLFVISDEVLCNWFYDNHRHISIASFPEMSNRTAVVNSLTKSGLFDFRIGWAVGSSELIDRLEKIMFWQNQFSPPILQIASETHLNHLSEWISPILKIQERKRTLLQSKLVDIGFQCFKPEGAIMMFPSIDNFDNNSVRFAETILERAHVFVSPGVAYLKDGYLRIGYGNSEDRIKEGLSRIASAIEKPSSCPTSDQGANWLK